MELQFKDDDWQKAEKRAKLIGREAEAVLQYAKHNYDSNAFQVLWDSFAAPLIHKSDGFIKIEQFYTHLLSKIVRVLTDKEYEKKLPRILMLAAEGRYSSSMLCRSFHTKRLSEFLHAFIEIITGYVRMYYYENSLFDILSTDNEMPSLHLTSALLLALEIRNKHSVIIEGVREAILGDNSKTHLSRRMIEGIIRSGNDDLLNNLLILLKIAGLQEGLRQQILESADCGSTDTFTRIVSFCVENDLFRFSSAVRALGVWTGFAMENMRPNVAKRLSNIALEVLTNEEKRKEYLASSDLSDIWMALWGYGCHNIDYTISFIHDFACGEDRYRKLLAWYFVFNSERSHYKMRMACKHLDERDPEILAWLTNCLAETNVYRYGFYANRERGPVKNELLPPKADDRRKLFNRLVELLPVIGEKKTVFTGMPFHFISITLSADPVVGCLMSLAGYDMDKTLTRRIHEFRPYMNADRKQIMIAFFLNPTNDQEDRDVLLSLLDDRSPAIKEKAVDALSKLELTDTELDIIADSLRSKSSPYRAAAVATLRTQPSKKIKPLLHRMLLSSEEYKIQAAADLVSVLEEDHPGTVAEFQTELLALKERSLSTQTEILLTKLIPNEAIIEEFSRDNGFGLYNPSDVHFYLDSLRTGYAPVTLNEKELYTIYPTEEEYCSLLSRIDAVFDRHADYEYETENWDGSRRKVLLGDVEAVAFPMPAGCGARSLNGTAARIEMLPFANEFLEAFGVFAKDPFKMIGLYCVSQGFRVDMDPDSYVYEDWFRKLFKKALVPSYNRSHNLISHSKASVNPVRIGISAQIIALLPKEHDQHAIFEKTFEIYRGLLGKIGDDNLKRRFRSYNGKYGIIYGAYDQHDTPINARDFGIWRQLIRGLDLEDDDFALWFKYEYQKEMVVGFDPEAGLSAEDIFRAYELKLLPREAIYARFLREETTKPRMLSRLTGEARYVNRLYERYPEAKEIVGTIVDRIVDVEEKRGELGTELTHHSLAIGKLYGSEHFVNLLAALGQETFYRGYEYTFDTDKRTVLSSLLKRCRPTDKDTPTILAERIKKTDISEKRLVEAIMYCPQWASIAEKALGWDKLKSAVWFFHAHINENYSAEKETEVALYSPISPEHFVDGAFDKNWFIDIYTALGEKRFMMLYKSAKYITSGSNNHKRSQLYSDAVLGKLDIHVLEKEIEDKRNQERLRCYPLIPIAPNDTREALRRYEFIQKFAKESKQFGAQRKESEKRAVRIALENLAITTELVDVNRLMWQMETQKTEELKPLMIPQVIGEITARLEIDDEGNSSVILEKSGKPLKTIPKAIAKDEVFLELKESAKDLKEQKHRSKESLERAMTERITFGKNEMISVLSNPVLAPMIRKLIWVTNGNLGFIRLADGNLNLIDVNGEVWPCGDTLIIAHPYDMIVAGNWHNYMRMLYDQSIIQPFKQVFREYYPITEDEKAERTISRRFAGYQVNPKRTLALLKGRGWTVDYEEGLQRVFYRENLVARLFALADWFSPADVEAPTLEMIQFCSRKNGEAVTLEDIPPVLFSEIMRDIDLVVSVAYVGNIDPETSMSTVEIRTALAQELTRLLKLDNVRFVGSHAKIDGKLAKWSVHMGSGIVHVEGKGMIPIIPVHSQSRGRVFLPFADDDPKTAEIMSKIILLAEDTRIKDPEMLSRI